MADRLLLALLMGLAVVLIVLGPMAAVSW